LFSIVSTSVGQSVLSTITYLLFSPPHIYRDVHPCRIVIVDDDDAIRSVVMAIAREAVPSAIVTEHTSSLHALQEVESGAANLLITNFHMPDMDGLTLVRKIRGERIAIPIIMVSGSDEIRVLGEQAGVDRFIAKHAIHPALGDAIRELVEVA
jgi:two-component system, chemotaxis family, chemotaxis protein CheY